MCSCALRLSSNVNQQITLISYSGFSFVFFFFFLNPLENGVGCVIYELTIDNMLMHYFFLKLKRDSCRFCLQCNYNLILILGLKMTSLTQMSMTPNQQQQQPTTQQEQVNSSPPSHNTTSYPSSSITPPVTSHPYYIKYTN